MNQLERWEETLKREDTPPHIIHDMKEGAKDQVWYVVYELQRGLPPEPPYDALIIAALEHYSGASVDTMLEALRETITQRATTPVA